MRKKRCTLCEEEKSIDDFYLTKHGFYQSRCKNCVTVENRKRRRMVRIDERVRCSYHECKKLFSPGLTGRRKFCSPECVAKHNLFRNRRDYGKDRMESHLARQESLIEIMGCTTEIDLRRGKLILIPLDESKKPKRVPLAEFQGSGLSLVDFVLELREKKKIRW